jgi:iron complex outermembrane recepter protein
LAPLLLAALLLAGGAEQPRSAGDDDDSAPDTDDPEIEEQLEVLAPRPGRTATDRSVVRAVLDTIPATSADELLQVVPGLQLSQHGGRGKAQQYLTRGFDAAHGSDVAVSLEGIPLNEVSNLHGQGYIDLGLVAPELVERLDVIKGPHGVDRGDFAVAASADLRLGLAEEGLGLRLLGGTDASLEGQARWRPRGRSSANFALVEGGFGEGVGQGRDFRFVRGGLGVGGRLGGAVGRLFLLGHDHGFSSPGVLREDDLEAGRMGLHDAWPTGSGGASRRLLLGGVVHGQGAHVDWRITGWGSARDLSLTNNFTGYARDPVHGDGRTITHRAGSGGLSGRVQRSFVGLGDVSLVRGGAEVRVDRFDQRQDGVDVQGSMHEVQLEARGTQVDGGAWVHGELGLFEVVRVSGGLRVDVLGFVVEAAEGGSLDQRQPGTARSQAVVPSPQAGLQVRPHRDLELFVAWGRGFRSPQARGVVHGQPAPVTRSDTLDGGARLNLLDRLDLRLGGFAVWLQDELVFDHASGRFLASGSTRRVGIEATGSVRVARPVRVELEVTWADGRYVASGALIPYAPRWMGVAGVHLDRLALARGDHPALLSLGLRARLVGPRPLPEGFVSRTCFGADLHAEVEIRSRIRLLLDVRNLFGAARRDGEFVYPSWFDTSAPQSQLPEVHITTGTPFTVRAGLEVLL